MTIGLLYQIMADIMFVLENVNKNAFDSYFEIGQMNPLYFYNARL